MNPVAIVPSQPSGARKVAGSCFSSTASGDTNGTEESLGKWKSEPALRELMLLALLSWLLFAFMISTLHGFFSVVDGFGDNSSYISIASAIRQWHFPKDLTIKQAWGLPYLMALVSTILRVSDRTALLGISLVSYFVALVLAYRLWGGWVAGFFMNINFYWMILAFLGGSEALFVSLLFAFFIFVRQERLTLACLFGSFCTVVRPLGFFSLTGIGLVLLWRRQFRQFFIAVAIGLMIGFLYMAPLATYFGDPLATVNSYRGAPGSGVSLFGFPLAAIVKGIVLYHPPWTNVLVSLGWVFLVLGAILAMLVTLEFREYARAHPVEIFFVAPYLWFIFSYNYAYWAVGNFARFAIPAIPFVLIALNRWLPKDRRVVWALAVICPVLAASSAMGARDVYHKIVGMLV